MFCPNCGKQCPDEANFCPACSANLGSRNQVPVAAATQGGVSAPARQAPDSAPYGRPAAPAPLHQPAAAQAPSYQAAGQGAGWYQRADVNGMPNQVVNVTTQQVLVKKNGLGTAGFVLALLAIFLGWVPVLGWIMWFLGALFSVIGLFRMPRGLAIAGTVISFIDLIVLVFVIGGIGVLSMF